MNVKYAIFVEKEKMVHQELLKRISVNPNVCFGKPCIKGTRIWVSLILDYLATGSSMEEILEAYPHIGKQDILACLAYGSAMSHEHFVEVELTRA